MSRTCKRCGDPYADDDHRMFAFRVMPTDSDVDYPTIDNGPYYGWMPTYSECFLCFCYALFGGMCEPWPGLGAWNPYPIDPHGPPCPPQNVYAGPCSDDDGMEEIEF